MKHDRIRVAELRDCFDCDLAITAIEGDYQNVAGGWKAWNSGYTTTLTAAAQRKIAAIERKRDRWCDPAWGTSCNCPTCRESGD